MGYPYPSFCLCAFWGPYFRGVLYIRVTIRGLEGFYLDFGLTARDLGLSCLRFPVWATLRHPRVAGWGFKFTVVTIDSRMAGRRDQVM